MGEKCVPISFNSILKHPRLKNIEKQDTTNKIEYILLIKSYNLKYFKDLMTIRMNSRC